MNAASLWCFLIFIVATSGYTPRVCKKAEHCNATECCRLGMERYSIPQCWDQGKVGDWCREGAVPEDRMLYYPDGSIMEVEGIYTLHCHCSEGLTCKGNKCRKL